MRESLRQAETISTVRAVLEGSFRPHPLAPFPSQERKRRARGLQSTRTRLARPLPLNMALDLILALASSLGERMAFLIEI